MRKSSFQVSKLQRTTSVAAILAASLTAAALARAARAEGEGEVETTRNVLEALAREIGGETADAAALARPDEDRTLRETGDALPWLEPLVGHAYARDLEARLARLQPGRAAELTRGREAFDARLDETIFGRELVAIVGGARLVELHHEGRLDDFLAEHRHKGRPLAASLGGLLAKARPLKAAKLIASGRRFQSFAHTYGCEIVGDLEPGAGVSRMEHLARLEPIARRERVRLILLASGDPRSLADCLAARTGARVVVLPADLGAEASERWTAFHERLVSLAVG